MKALKDYYQSGDWKGEKHVPAIIAPESVEAGELVEVKVNIGEEIGHPNTFEHYIGWIKLYFKSESSNFPVEIGTYNFSAHGEFDVYSEPYVVVRFKAKESGTLLASSYCNIHGLWENSLDLQVK